MRLINIETLTLEEFFGDDIPAYAILSHRWEEEELTFQQMNRSKVFQAFGPKSTKGYHKLKMACQKTATFKLRYLWIDTCSIDKSSSAELTEAINSMFRWYQNAEVCLAYLSDVGRPLKKASNDAKDMSSEIVSPKPFKESVWFTRAWTLQELIAPRDLHFYSLSWEYIGTKESLAPHIQSVTKIPKPILLHTESLSTRSIAEKMSWAAGRKATRTEDIAYSLLGVFNVYMPLLYGEGEFAFTRLQEEIIKRSLDKSFLLWNQEESNTNLLASSPDDFSLYETSGNVWVMDSISTTPFALTNAGLEIELDLYWWKMNMFAAKIEYTGKMNKTGQYPAWYVLLKYSRNGNYLYRTGAMKTTLEQVPKFRKEKITILRQVLDTQRSEEDFLGFEVHHDSLTIQEVLRKEKGVSWTSDPRPSLSLRCAFDPQVVNANAYMHCDLAPDFRLYVNVSFDFNFNPNISINRTADMFYFAHTSEKNLETDLKMDHRALTVVRPPPGQEGVRRWVCKLVDRNNVYIPLPEFLCPTDHRLALYVEFILYPGSNFPSGVWHVALVKREVSRYKSILDSFLEDRFFAEEAEELKLQMIKESRLLKPAEVIVKDDQDLELQTMMDELKVKSDHLDEEEHDNTDHRSSGLSESS